MHEIRQKKGSKIGAHERESHFFNSSIQGRFFTLEKWKFLQIPIPHGASLCTGQSSAAFEESVNISPLLHPAPQPAQCPLLKVPFRRLWRQETSMNIYTWHSTQKGIPRGTALPGSTSPKEGFLCSARDYHRTRAWLKSLCPLASSSPSPPSSQDLLQEFYSP